MTMVGMQAFVLLASCSRSHVLSGLWTRSVAGAQFVISNKCSWPASPEVWQRSAMIDQDLEWEIVFQLLWHGRMPQLVRTSWHETQLKLFKETKAMQQQDWEVQLKQPNE